MKHKTAELEGALLDAAVAKAAGITLLATGSSYQHPAKGWTYDGKGEPAPWSPSTMWAIGGPIIYREGIATGRYEYETPAGQRWHAGHGDDVDGGAYFSSLDLRYTGPTPLIAAMRAYVASKLGEEVDLP